MLVSAMQLAMGLTTAIGNTSVSLWGECVLAEATLPQQTRHIRVTRRCPSRGELTKYIDCVPVPNQLLADVRGQNSIPNELPADEPCIDVAA